jgi:metal-dependent HD superfamily phosphatase/phosphodiesterase
VDQISNDIAKEIPFSIYQKTAKIVFHDQIILHTMYEAAHENAQPTTFFVT